MSRSLNKVQIIGRLGADPDIRFTQDGRPVAGLKVATSETWNDKQGQRQERTEWHSVSLFGKLAEIAQQYLRKGSRVYIEGQLKTEKWTDKTGADRYTTKIVIPPFNGQMLMLDPRPGGDGGSAGYGGSSGQGYGGGAPQVPAYAGPQGSNYVGAPQQQPQPSSYQQPAPQKQAPASPDPLDQTPEFDDDIPF